MRAKPSLRRRGLSLVELLLSMLIVGLAMGAVTQAYFAGGNFEARYSKAVASQRLRARFEDDVTGLLQGAEIGSATSFFVAPVPPTKFGRKNAPGIAFTTWSEPVPSRYLQTQKQEFETLNVRFGPQGGPTEVAISTDPAGDAGLRHGIFLREQRPPDSDISQGGEERVLSESVSDVRFEFFDGNDWQTTWDTRNAQKGKLPLLVRITYVVVGDDKSHSFLVRLPLQPAKAATT